MLRRRRPWFLLAAACCVTTLTLASLTRFVAGQDAAPAKEIAWRTDYNVALAESEKRGLPLVIDFTTTPCIWCDRMDTSTFRDSRIIDLINQQYVPLKIHASRDPKM